METRVHGSGTPRYLGVPKYDEGEHSGSQKSNSRRPL
jgi:hypothetical protein